MARHQSKEPSKPDTSRLNILYIICVLRDHTDEWNPMGISEITDRINKKFSQLSGRDSFMSRDTVRRTLITYVDGNNALGGNSFQSFSPLGFQIKYTEEQGRRLYYYKNDFDEPEIRMLIDAIKTCNYLAPEDEENIIQKLTDLQPKTFKYYKQYEEVEDVRSKDSLLIQNVDFFNKVIRNKSAARIVYCSYDRDGKLVPRADYPRVVRPVSMMWSNGFYYLLAFSDKYQHTVNYRMDRITEVEEVILENKDIQDKIDPAQYRLRHPIMFSGSIEWVKVLCRDTGKNYIMNVIMDYFGKPAKVVTAPDEVVLKYTGRTAQEHLKEGTTWMEVTVQAAVEGVEMWAAQYCEDCLILSPETSRQKLLEKLQRGAGLYGLGG